MCLLIYAKIFNRHKSGSFLFNADSTSEPGNNKTIFLLKTLLAIAGIVNISPPINSIIKSVLSNIL